MKKLASQHVRITSLVFALLIIASAYALAADDSPSSLPAPPVAKKVPKTTEINGHAMVDNYYWLRDKKNPEVKAYLEAENSYTDALMKPTEGLQKKLYDEMLSRIKETDVEVPYKEGRLLLLFADRSRQAIRHSLQEKRQHGCSGRDCSGRERAGQRAEVHVAGSI